MYAIISIKWSWLFAKRMQGTARYYSTKVLTAMPTPALGDIQSPYVLEQLPNRASRLVF